MAQRNYKSKDFKEMFAWPYVFKLIFIEHKITVKYCELIMEGLGVTSA